MAQFITFLALIAGEHVLISYYWQREAIQLEYRQWKLCMADLMPLWYFSVATTVVAYGTVAWVAHSSTLVASLLLAFTLAAATWAPALATESTCAVGLSTTLIAALSLAIAVATAIETDELLFIVAGGILCWHHTVMDWFVWFILHYSQREKQADTPAGAYLNRHT